MNLEEFQQIVDDVLHKLPSEFANALDNVGIVVEIWPSDEEFASIKAHPSSSLLFGLYRGIPKTIRPHNYSALPDKITIYAGPILMDSKDLADAKKRIKDTVLHEVGHHFGLSDAQLRQRGY
jgi:predicted Zn-dependent protease with MMP-like domain